MKKLKQIPWIFSDVYAWEGDKAVMQVLAFKTPMDRDIFEARLPNYKERTLNTLATPENGLGATYKIRAVMVGNGNYTLVIRKGTDGVICFEDLNNVPDYHEVIQRGKDLLPPNIEE